MRCYGADKNVALQIKIRVNWKDEILIFLGAGRRQAQVEFFFDDEAEDARDWLGSESE